MGRRALGIAWILIWAFIVGASPSAALTGQVVDTDGEPVPGAKVCLMVGTREILCDQTVESGHYSLPDSKLTTMRISAKGFLTRFLAAVQHDAAIPLEPAAVLLARLVDASSGEPIPEGGVYLLFTSGQWKGPFPVNKNGVRIGSLVPGEIRVHGEANGYLKSEIEVVVLEPRKESQVTLKLTPDDPS